MSSKDLLLQWNHHGQSLSTTFKTLQADDSLVDCTLAAEGQYVQAHKLVLAASSPYFEMVFKVVKKKHPVVILKDVKFEDLKAILDFMYCGEVHIPEQRLREFLRTADCLQVKALLNANSLIGKDSNDLPQDGSGGRVSCSARKRRRVMDEGEAPEHEFVEVVRVISRNRPQSSAAVQHTSSHSSVGSPSASAAPAPAPPPAPMTFFPNPVSDGVALPTASAAHSEHSCSLPMPTQPTFPQAEAALQTSLDNSTALFVKTEAADSEDIEFEREELKNINVACEVVLTETVAQSDCDQTALFSPDARSSDVKQASNESYREVFSHTNIDHQDQNVECLDIESSDDSAEKDMDTENPWIADPETQCGSESARVAVVNDKARAGMQFHKESVHEEISIEGGVKSPSTAGDIISAPNNADVVSPSNANSTATGSERPSGVAASALATQGEGKQRAPCKRKVGRPRNEKRHICAVCQKDLKNPAKLRVHERTHLKNKPHQCGTCKKRYPKVSYLRGHERYSGCANYECSTCQERFVLRRDLKKHQLIHKATHWCNDCGYMYHKIGQLRDHIRTVHQSEIRREK